MIALFFSTKSNEIPPNLTFENIQVTFVDNHKHFSVTLSNDAKWNNHIQNVVKSASKTLPMMGKLFNKK